MIDRSAAVGGRRHDKAGVSENFLHHRVDQRLVLDQQDMRLGMDVRRAEMWGHGVSLHTVNALTPGMFAIRYKLNPLIVSRS